MREGAETRKSEPSTNHRPCLRPIPYSTGSAYPTRRKMESGFERWCGGWMSLFRALYAIRRAPHSIRRRDGTRRRENRENVVDTKNLVSITEANQNFSRVARLVDENGVAVILKNNVPRYVLVEYSQVENAQTAEDEDVMA